MSCEDADLDAAVDTLMDGAMFNAGPVLLRDRADLCAREPLRRLRRKGRGLGAGATSSATRWSRQRRSARWPTSASPTRCAPRSRRPWPRAPRPLIDRACSPRMTAAPYLTPQVLTGRDSRHARDARGKLRPGRRHHAGQGRRGGDRADERQPLRPDRLALDRRPRPRPSGSADRIETGTVFMNRADYLDPALCWTGCKDTGRGAGAVGAWLPGADAPEILPPEEGRRMSPDRQLVLSHRHPVRRRPHRRTGRGLRAPPASSGRCWSPTGGWPTCRSPRRALDLLEAAGLGRAMFSRGRSEPERDEPAEAGVAAYPRGRA